MNNNIKISIILPSLNVKPYISECLDSVINQSIIDDIEIICVDSGSTDGTLSIIKKYEATGRLKLLTTEEKSYGKQVNKGIEEASGDYIGIVETDDFVDKYMYEALYDAAISNKADVVMSDHFVFSDGANERKCLPKKITNDYSLYNKVLRAQECKGLMLCNFLNPTGIFRKDYLNDHTIRFNETLGASFQDIGFLFQLLISANRWVNIDTPFYYYRQDNPNSSIAKKDKMDCAFDEYSFIYNIICEHNEYKWSVPLYLRRKFGTSLYTLDRVSWDLKRKCICRIRDEYAAFEEENGLDLNLFSDYWIKILQEIMSSPDKYWEKHKALRDEVYAKIETDRPLIIYGAGNVAKKIYSILDEFEKIRTIGFAVSNIENEHEFKNKMIREIWEYMKYREDAIIVLGVSSKHKDAILCKLYRFHFKNIIVLEDRVVDVW